MKTELTIEGMTCQNCVRHATQALQELAGVTSVKVDLESKSARVHADRDIAEELFQSAIQEVGYSVTAVN